MTGEEKENRREAYRLLRRVLIKESQWEDAAVSARDGITDISYFRYNGGVLKAYAALDSLSTGMILYLAAQCTAPSRTTPLYNLLGEVQSADWEEILMEYELETREPILRDLVAYKDQTSPMGMMRAECMGEVYEITNTAPGTLAPLKGPEREYIEAVATTVYVNKHVASSENYRRHVADQSQFDEIDNVVTPQVLEYLKEDPSRYRALTGYMRERGTFILEMDWDHYLLYLDNPAYSLREGVL